ncbi:MAG: nuclear transport factor 2 family protein [Cyclobacteriaceae bacterium]|nr:nuclear transport factor 2 family protein [Cyclobacteriaceae bacterium]
MNRTTKGFLLTFVALIVCYQSALSQRNPTETLILKISSQKSDWMVKQKIDSLKALMDDQFLFIHSNGWTQSAKDFFDDFASGKLVYTHIEPMEASVRIFNETAVLTGKGNFSGTVEGKPFKLPLIYTEVYVVKNQRWIWVSRQSTRLP